MRQNHKDKKRAKNTMAVMDNENVIILPTMPQNQLKKYIIKYSDEKFMSELTEKEDYDKLSHALIHGMSYSMITPNDVFNGLYTTENATNEHTLNKEPLYHHSLDLKKATGKLTGQNIKFKLNTKLGIQSTDKVELFNSGFYVVIGNIKTVDTIHLSTLIAKSISVIGSSTAGLIYSHESIMYHKVLIEFIHDHILATNLDTGIDNILEHISIYDIDSLILGLINCLSPNGYESILLCKNQYDENNEDVKCDYVAKTKLLASTLTYTSRKLSNKQKAIIGSTKVTLEDIEIYKEDLTTTDTIDVIDDTVLKLTVPSIDDYLSAGESWIHRLNDMVNEALGKDPSDGDRDMYLEQLNNSLSLNWYNHWVTEIMIDGDSYISGKLDIVEALDTLSTDVDIALPILEAINTFINEHSISIAGIATFTCPKCKKDIAEKTKHKNFEYITPINTLQLFLATSTRR